MEKKFEVKVELSAGEMAAVLRAVAKVRLEEWCVCEKSREWVKLSDADSKLRVQFADALAGVSILDESGRWGRCLRLVDKWQRSGECVDASYAAANVRLGKVA